MMTPDYKKMFRDARATLEARRGRGPREQKISWNESKVEYVRRYRRALRVALLDELCPERKCTLCGETKTRSRQLVVVKDSQSGEPFAAVCRSCWNGLRAMTRERGTVAEELKRRLEL